MTYVFLCRCCYCLPPLVPLWLHEAQMDAWSSSGYMKTQWLYETPVGAWTVNGYRNPQWMHELSMGACCESQCVWSVSGVSLSMDWLDAVTGTWRVRWRCGMVRNRLCLCLSPRTMVTSRWWGYPAGESKHLVVTYRTYVNPCEKHVFPWI